MIKLELAFGLLVLVLWVFSVIDVVTSDEGAIRHLPKLPWLLLVLFFAATQYFFFTAPGMLKLLGVGTLAFGLVFTLFEVIVAVLQAYVFALLTAVYIQLAVAEEH